MNTNILHKTTKAAAQRSAEVGQVNDDSLDVKPFRGESTGSAHSDKPLASSELVNFITELGRALHRYGVPAHRLEATLEGVAAAMGVGAEFFAMPTALFARLTVDGEERTVLIRLSGGQLDLDKLRAIDELVAEAATVGPRVGLQRLAEIADSPGRYATWALVIAFALVSISAARMFGGGWREAVAAAIVGLGNGLLTMLAGRIRQVARLFDPLAAAAAGAIAVTIATQLSPLSIPTVTLAGLIVLIPGLAVTTGVNELATQHLASGSMRLVGALVSFLTIAVGVAAGVAAAHWWWGAPITAVAQPLPEWTVWPALGMVSLALVVLFNARPSDAGWVTLASALAFVSSRYAAQAFEPVVGAFVGALCLGMASNTFARALRRPASIMLVPGLLLLVPGSLGFRSVDALLAHDVVSGIQQAAQMGFVAVALVVGLLIASALVSPRRAL